ncbi:MAG TPA: DEAD/DEAH box helicase [Anaerolineae bacterium]|mgnify:CR=1 FL=1|nr:DEAD/DEAH box helicase [Anaerolineae bacterium]HQH39072.1 DEAD/DEAH box helicase [Anaerolineae bacterium]
MPIETVAAALRADAKFMRNVTAWRTLPAREAQTTPWPSDLDSHLATAGRKLGIDALYTHQARAGETALCGENVILTTGTASGKTLGYTLPLLNTLLHEPTATALLLFPTKALAHDQITALEAWIDALQAPLALRPYDGDTPQRHRATIRNEARILVSNPDMLHLGILPHHTQWVRFFSGLRYIVLDELHTYRGIFGSHVANVLRRARRVARFYGAEPQFISASATIANARELAEALWEDPVVAVEEDGAPYGQRHVIFYNPPLLNPALGLRASAAAEAITLTLKLLHAGVQTILFARARVTVELLLRELRERAVLAGFSPDAIQGYRGGYLPQERRAIERDLRTGKTRVVVATNALELGIDIGALDASILVGYPGTIAATRQQMGRAGRRAGSALSVLIATPSPLDQYLITHPEYFFGRSPEEARVNPNTVSLLAAHLTCAAFELPFERDEPFGQAQDAGAILEALGAEGVLHRRNGRFTWIGESYPAQGLSLRSATPDNIVIQSTAGAVVGTVDRPSAPTLVHEGAVYLHSGEMYLIENLDWEQGIALARPADLDYYTLATSTTQVERLAVRRVFGVLDVTPQLTDEEVRVHTQAAAYRRVQQSTHETLGWGEIDLPEQVMETEAFRLTLPSALVEELAEVGVMLAPLDYGPAWPQIREAILARDGQRCRVCGAAAQAGHPLEVHHLTPLRTFMTQYPRQEALRLAHAPENLLTVCPTCHRQLERARGARTALGGLAYLLRNLAPVFLMGDPGDLGTAVEARDAESGLPAIVVFDSAPGGAGLSPRLVDLWPRLVEAMLERVQTCPCADGCPSCVGPVGESEPGAKAAARQLLERMAEDAYLFC